MKVSVITAVFNRAATIQAAIDSVASQTAADMEYITVDGMSNDNTNEIIKSNSSNISLQIRESDNGIYDALNKGINAATGDIVGFLHADDLLASNTALKQILECFEHSDLDAVYGDLVYVDCENPGRIIRYWKSGPFKRSRFRWGWMPPHPTVYVRKSIYEKFGMYRTDLGSAADYECMIRLMFKHEIRVGYLPKTLVQMRTGGESNASVRNRLAANKNDKAAWEVNGLKPPFALRFSKPLSKIPQYLKRPKPA